MSGEALFQVLGSDVPKTSPASRLVLVGLAWIIPRGSHSLTAPPAAIVDRIAGPTGLGVSTVYRHLGTLADAGLIEVEDLAVDRRIRLNVGAWRVSLSEKDPRSIPYVSLQMRIPPIYQEIQRGDRETVADLDRLAEIDRLREKGLRWSEVLTEVVR